MSINDSFDISASAIDTNRIRMEIIASNLANMDSTRSVDGGPYRRKIPVIGEKSITFSEELRRAQGKMGGGVEVITIIDDTTPFQKIYNPGHPDADENGFVSLPNVSMSKEMVDMVYTSKLYEANITAFNIAKKMAQDTLQIP